MTADTRDDRIPVDRGWAWIVLAGSLMISTINVGTEKSYGIFFIEFLRTFKGTVFMTVMINTMLTVVYCVTASSLLLVGFTRLSIRTFVFVGITLSAVGYGISSFATGLEFLIASQSILIGAGNALHNPPIFILLGEYFEKKKGLANGVFIAGNSLGGILMPPLYRYVFDQYGLRGGLIITAGITLNSLVAAALLRPTDFYTKNGTELLHGNGYVDKDAISNTDNTRATNAEMCLEDRTDSDTACPFISTDRSPIHDKAHNVDVIVDKISRSSIVRYLSTGDITSMSSLTESIDRHITNTEDDQFSTGGLLFRCKSKIDCSLLKNSLFILFLAIYCFGNVAIMCAHIYIPTYARDIGIEDQSIAILVSITSVTDFVGRILAGFLADKPSISPHMVVIISQVVVGTVLQFTVYYTSFWRLVIFVAIFGSTAGMIAALFPPMMIEIVGMKRYRSAMAIFIICVCLFNGLALPILGYFRDITDTFHVTFHVMGASSFIAIGLLVIFHVITKKKERKNEMDTQKN
ncbi:monocarboxylate transporter 12-B-like [Ylistrum balloti]|uniref:monocarboxylate transporter 12-B-like n=1 Tax=Ylistrum balloti TaxID=509963 RepID=UPI002905AAD3|nr:monocarboxylate transporter 12-B-like [Ylistrum balloti]